MKTTKNFEIRIYNDQTRNLDNYLFVCKMSTAPHKKLKEFAGSGVYWFKGLTGRSWFRGGYYSLDCGFINPTPNIKNNAQGVVYDNEVYLLKKIVKVD